MRFLNANKGSMVHWEESIRFAVWALAVDKVKASLTMLGVVIGSAAIVLVVTIASTGKIYMISQVEGIGANLAYASLDRAGTTTVPEDELTPGDFSAARQALPAVRAVAGTYDLPVDLQLRGQTFHPLLVGVTRDFESIRNLQIISGRNRLGRFSFPLQSLLDYRSHGRSRFWPESRGRHSTNEHAIVAMKAPTRFGGRQATEFAIERARIAGYSASYRGYSSGKQRFFRRKQQREWDLDGAFSDLAYVVRLYRQDRSAQ
jgi:hypothetical protein